MKFLIAFASLIYLFFNWFISPTPKQPGALLKQNSFLSAQNENIVLSISRGIQAKTAHYLQISQTPTPPPDPTPVDNESGTKSLPRAPKPTPTPLKIPPPTDPKNLSIMILLLVIIVLIIIIGLLINRKNIRKP